MAGLDEVIPEIHRLLAEEEEPQQVEAKETKRKLLKSIVCCQQRDH